jgi:hypothetical protein
MCLFTSKQTRLFSKLLLNLTLGKTLNKKAGISVGSHDNSRGGRNLCGCLCSGSRYCGGS